MASSTILKNFIEALIYSKVDKTIERICEDVYYDKDYLSKIFKRISNSSAQSYMNYCRVIFVLFNFINGKDISLARGKYNYTENAFNKALRRYNIPSITTLKGDIDLKEMIIKEHEKIKLIGILSKADKPIKAKELGDLCQYIQEFRDCKEFCICSKPGPKGGYFLSNNGSDISLCEEWINHWRQAMNIHNNFSIV